MARQGFFITFEGIDGSGKTTQLKRLEAWLQAQGHEVLVTREPGGTALSERIREILLDPRQQMAPLTELLLYEASRHQLVAEVIRPALERGGVVLCDRFADASIAYQGFGRGLGIFLAAQLNHIATGGITPDLTIVLDLPVAEGLRRREYIGQTDRIEQGGREFYERVREAYLRLARSPEPGRHIMVIDATQSEEKIAKEVAEIVSECIADLEGIP